MAQKDISRYNVRIHPKSGVLADTLQKLTFLTRPAVLEGLAQAKRHEFAIPAQVETAFRRFDA